MAALAEHTLVRRLALDVATDADRRTAAIDALLDTLLAPVGGTQPAALAAVARLLQRATTQHVPRGVLSVALAPRVAPLLAHAAADVRKVREDVRTSIRANVGVRAR
jgi:hypothetical protein